MDARTSSRPRQDELVAARTLLACLAYGTVVVFALFELFWELVPATAALAAAWLIVTRADAG